MQKVTILKFGGTSMGDEHTWRRVIEIIKRYDAPVVVVSATARTTRKLVKAAQLAPQDLEKAFEIAEGIGDRHKKLIHNLLSNSDRDNTAATQEQCEEWIDNQIHDLQNYLRKAHKSRDISTSLKDAISSVGEQLSSYLFAACAPLFDINTSWTDAREIITTDSQFGSANPIIEQIQNNVAQLAKAVSNNQIPVMGGYYGEDSNGNITTLGFEGSDYTASLIGAALEATAIEIWTDVSGIFTCDPRVVDTAKPIQELSFTEATELAYFGAKVLHPSTMKPASRKEIPVKVKNIFEPDQSGTIIHASAKENGLAKALTFIEDATIITIQASESTKGYEFLADIFQVLNSYHLPVDVVTTTEASVSLALEASRFNDELIQRLEEFGDVQQSIEQSIISLIGCSFSKAEVIAQNALKSISDTEIAMMSFNKPKRNLNIVVAQNDLIQAVNKIHNSIF